MTLLLQLAAVTQILIFICQTLTVLVEILHSGYLPLMTFLGKFHPKGSNIPKTEAVGKILLNVSFLETFESL